MHCSPLTVNQLLTVNQMATADRLAVASGIPATELMENAGRAVAREIQNRWSPRQCVVLCGPGNNGGDGYVIARILLQAGWPTSVQSLCPLDSLKGEAAYHARLWTGKTELLEDDPSYETIRNSELVIDALFGAGLSRPIDGHAKRALQFVTEHRIPCVAVDVPSGVMGDTGQTEFSPKCELTVTFFRLKPGHLLLPAKALCGDTVVADIGIPAYVLEQIAPSTFKNHPELWRDSFPSLSIEGHKYHRGHALVVGGSQMTGAARLSALAAARIGSGLVSIAAPTEAFAIYATSLQSIMIKPFATEVELDTHLTDLRTTAFLIGPGAGRNEPTRTRTLRVLATGRPTVLDADALSVFENDAESLANAISGPCVMTPHEGEFRRLYDLPGDKLERAREASRRSNAVVVLKGPDTVIASPDGRAAINANAPPTLATAGSGDVLSGIILGLMAQGMPPFEAAAAGVWIHGESANLFGPGLIADDLPNMIPRVLSNGL